MARHKKTRQQKIIADVRRNTSSAQASFISGAYSFNNTIVAAETHHETIAQNSYVSSDLRKTFFITISILLFQIVLFYLLKNHLVVLPMIKGLY